MSFGPGRRRHRTILSGLVVAVLSAGGPVLAQTTGTGATIRVSVPTGGGQTTASTDTPPAISTDGRFAAFHSNATNLVPNDTNEAGDVFVRDVNDAITYRVSVAFNGAQAAFQDTPPRSNSSLPAINADGRFVAFLSGAFNLVPNDTNGVPAAAASRDLTGRDVFVRDRRDGTTTRVSVATGGAQGDCGVSTGPQPPPGQLIPCGGGVASPEQPAISADGRFVAFGASATNLVTGCTPAPTPPGRCDTNGQADVFVHDRNAGATTRVNLCNDATKPDGLPPPPATPRNCDSSLRQSAGGASDQPSMSADGNVIAFRSSSNNLVLSDTNGISDIFVHDRRNATTTLVSVTATGGQACPPAPAAGSCTVPPGQVLGSFNPSISDDGCFVAFVSSATNLLGPGNDANGFEDIFVRGPLPGCTGAAAATTTRVSAPGVTGSSTPVGEPNGRSLFPDISSDGQFVSFESDASNLLPAGQDTNNATDVFVRDRNLLTTAAVARVSMPNGGGQANSASFLSALSGNGRLVAFASDASNLTATDTNQRADIFLNDRLAPAAVEPTGGGGGDSGGGGGTGGAGDGEFDKRQLLAQNQPAAAAPAVASGEAPQPASGSSSSTLPRTGLDPLRLIRMAAWLLAAGLAITMAERRWRWRAGGPLRAP